MNAWDHLARAEEELSSCFATYEDDADPRDLWMVLDKLRQVKRLLADGEVGLENCLGDRLSGTTTDLGDVILHRSRRTKRTQWDTDDLLRAVLDTKAVDKETGEVVEETPLQKVLAVWRLPDPRITVLRERGLDPDDYCRREDVPGWKVKVPH